MKHLDFTIDFETTSLTANAAPMQVAIVPWRREKEPFFNDDDTQVYIGYVDLRTCFVEGFDFDQATAKWWSEKSQEAKEAVCKGLAEPIEEVAYAIFSYLRDIVSKHHVESLCLWSQGMDVDIAILRNLCRRYDIDLDSVLLHTAFRDCRTVILEAALVQAERIRLHDIAVASDILSDGTPVPHTAPTPEEILRDPQKAYDLYEPLPESYAANGVPHDALYDALRSSWNTWQALRWLYNK